tara:strand:- start:3244 stop:4242 length:999 start_codon:yes stop_codon:yes gene_type:complete
MKFLISTHFYTRRFLHPLETGHGVWKVREGILIKLKSEKGTGFGEVAPIPFFKTETIDEARAFIGSLGKLVDLDDLQIPETLPCTAFAFSSAVAQIDNNHAKKADKNFPIAGLLPSGRSSREALQTKTSAGFKTFKWKIGVHAFEEESQIFEELINSCKSTVQFRLDANAGMDKETLEKWLQLTQKYRQQVEFFEQPLAVGMEGEMAEFSAKYEMPIALDESLNGPNGKRWLDSEIWAGLFVIKPSALGSTEFLKHCLSKIGSRCILSSSFETGIGLATCLELASTLNGNSFALGFDTQAIFSDDYSSNQSFPILSLSQVVEQSNAIITNVF